jgi:hypothetical protein
MTSSSNISIELERYLRSDAWRRRRDQYLRRRRHCERCGAKKLLSVHHLAYSALDGKERDADLQALCVLCHARQHPGKRVMCGPFAVTYDPSWGVNGGSRIDEYPF